MAEQLGIDHQRLQQFISSSTWPVDQVRERLAARAARALAPDAWVVDDSGFPKDGTGSPGVARQYSGTLGKVGNCQVGVSMHAVTDIASCPLNWRLFLPACWDPQHAGDPAAAAFVERRRTRCRIPVGEGHRPKWRLAAEMLDELAIAVPTTFRGLEGRPGLCQARALGQSSGTRASSRFHFGLARRAVLGGLLEVAGGGQGEDDRAPLHGPQAAQRPKAGHQARPPNTQAAQRLLTPDHTPTAIQPQTTNKQSGEERRTERVVRISARLD
jgi:hypothetical protein